MCCEAVVSVGMPWQSEVVVYGKNGTIEVAGCC